MCRKHREVEKEVEWNKGASWGAHFIIEWWTEALLSVTVQSTVIFFFLIPPTQRCAILSSVIFFPSLSPQSAWDAWQMNVEEMLYFPQFGWGVYSRVAASFFVSSCSAWAEGACWEQSLRWSLPVVSCPCFEALFASERPSFSQDPSRTEKNARYPFAKTTYLSSISHTVCRRFV